MKPGSGSSARAACLSLKNICPNCSQSTAAASDAFTTDLGEAVERCEAVFIAVGTPQGDGGAADLSYVEAVVAEIARAIKSYKVIVEKSTVPVYTNDWIRRVLHRHGVEAGRFDVVSNPEFLREGTAVVDFLHPDRIVVGPATSVQRKYSGESMSRSPRAAITRSRELCREHAARHVQRSCWSLQRRARRSSSTRRMHFWP